MIFMVLGFQDSLFIEVFMVCELERYKSTMHWGQIEGLSDPIDSNDFLKRFLIQFLMFVAWFSWHVCLFSKV
jgi:hypothetical protein